MTDLLCAYASGTAPSMHACAQAGCRLCVGELDEVNRMRPYRVTVPIVDFGPSVVAMSVNAFDQEDALFRASCRTADEGYEIDHTRTIEVEETTP